MLIGLPDLVKKKKVIENRDNYFFISHVNLPYKTSISPTTIAMANTVTRLS